MRENIQDAENNLRCRPGRASSRHSLHRSAGIVQQDSPLLLWLAAASMPWLAELSGKPEVIFNTGVRL
jgi:hypothetical protein